MRKIRKNNQPRAMTWLLQLANTDFKVANITMLNINQNYNHIERKDMKSLGLNQKIGHWNHSVQFSRSVVSDSLRPHGLQHPRPHCPSPTPWVYPNSSPLSWWGHPTISSSVIPFSSCPQYFPASGYFLMSQFFACDGQSMGVSASASVLPMNILDWFPLGWSVWISLQSKGLSSVFSNTIVQKHQFFSAQLSL